jgi:membrane protein involved in colicin uptake
VAEIPIQPKKTNRGILPLILALIVVVALIWYIMSRRSDNKATPAGGDSTSTGAVMSGPQQMAVHFQYSTEGSTYGKTS